LNGPAYSMCLFGGGSRLVLSLPLPSNPDELSIDSCG
jgi:hypothetical protein